MKSYWKHDGNPGPDGRLCFVTDLEDGTNPVNVYGKDREEIFAKLARTNAHAQLELARRPSPNSPNAPAAATPTAAPRRTLTADEKMQATADLSLPGKSAAAVVKLFEDSTGIDTTKMILNNFAAIAMEWEQEHPEFYRHPANKKMVADGAIRYAGGIRFVTKDFLTQAFQELQQGGFLIEEPLNSNQLPPVAQPEENPAASATRRPALFATSIPATRLRAPQTTPPRTLKYTAEQIRKMPLAESSRLIRINDKDYAEACEAYYGNAQATA